MYDKKYGAYPLSLERENDIIIENFIIDLIFTPKIALFIEKNINIY